MALANDTSPQSTPPVNRAAGGLPGRLFAPVDIAWLVAFRIIFGAMMLWQMAKYFRDGLIGTEFLEPTFHFTYFGFDWVRPLPGLGMYLVFAGLTACAACLLLGLFYRTAAVLFCIGFVYIFLLEQALFRNHYYLIALISFLMILLPAHRAFSMDVLLRPALQSNTVPRWTLWLMRLQIAIPYFYGGLAKLSHDWLHGEPIRLTFTRPAEYPFIGQFTATEETVQLMVWGGLVFDLVIVPLLLWRRTRLVAYALAVGFHVTNSVLFEIGIFPWFMILATLVFMPPDWPQRLLRIPRATVSGSPSATGTLSSLQQRTLVLLGFYVAVQLLVPLRHFLYPGNVNWTEQGHRFAWHMKLRDKHGGIRFYVSEGKTGRRGTIDMRPYLKSWQAQKMAQHPDMILQFAHFLAEDLRRKGFPDVEIHAFTLISLNGRKPQSLIDPKADLLKLKRSWQPASWIVPLKEPLREHAWDYPLSEWERRLDLDAASLANPVRS